MDTAGGNVMEPAARRVATTTGSAPGMTIAYRDAGAEDRDALVALGRASFDAAFGHLYRPEDLAAFLHGVHSPETVAAQLADRAIAYRLATRGDRLAGFAKLADGARFGVETGARRPVALSQLYTDPALTGQGIGARLMDWTIEEARRRRADAVQLSVWSGNEGAQRFYARHGFVKVADIDFMVGSHRDEEFLLERRL